MSIVGMKRIPALGCLSLFLALLPAHAEEKKAPKAWTDPETATAEDPDFLIQGEYRDETMGAQVVALGGGNFDVYLLEGGLPGAGWEPGKTRTALKGLRKGEPAGTGGFTVTVGESAVSLIAGDGKVHKLTRTERESPTLGAKPPEGAVVLFDGTNADEWENGKVVNGHLQATNVTSKRSFGDYHLHLEFRTPYMPAARGQGRGNSGIYHSGRWETQILDSFGLEGRENESGGIYSVAKPRLNMCLPPLAWQTYDVDFTAAKFDAEGKRTAWPRITVKLNGILVHEDLELTKDFTASAPLNTPLTSPEGPVFLQNHSNPVEFRNIWIVPGKP
jgi:hypothetical protein